MRTNSFARACDTATSSSPASSPTPNRSLDDFIRHGMALNAAAALDVEALSINCDWVKAELNGTHTAQGGPAPDG